MSVDFLTRTIVDGPPIGRVRVAAKEIEILLGAGGDRGRVQEVMPICRVRPLIMKGMPKPIPGRSWISDMAAFENEWSAKNPEAYRTMRVFGAGSFVGKAGAGEDFWLALKQEFAEFDDCEVNLKQLGQIHWRAVQSVMSPNEFAELAMDYR